MTRLARLLLLSALLALSPSIAAAERVIVALGDSLTAGLGVAKEDAYPALLQARLQREGYDYRVVNAGVSGDTSAGGLRRLDWALRANPELLIVALGANDGLRGLPVAALRDNLMRIVQSAQANGVRVLLVGMRMPPNYGADYTSAFAAVFPDVARATRATLVPFLLEGVAADRRLNQPDGIHPNAEGHRAISDMLWPYVRGLLVPRNTFVR